MSEADWLEFFAGLDGSPEVLITDRYKSNMAAVSASDAFPTPPVKRTCRWHELRPMREKLTREGTRLPHAAEVWKILRRAPLSSRSWVRLHTDLGPYLKSWNPLQLEELATWYLDRDRILGDLFTASQRGIEWGWTTGKVEWVLEEVKAAFKDRAFGPRNAYRTGLLLALIRVRLNSEDRHDDYLTAIADHLDRPTLQMTPQRTYNDIQNQPSLHPW